MFVDAFCEEIDNDNNKIKELLETLPQTLEIDKNS